MAGDKPVRRWKDDPNYIGYFVVWGPITRSEGTWLKLRLVDRDLLLHDEPHYEFKIESDNRSSQAADINKLIETLIKRLEEAQKIRTMAREL